MTTRHSRNLLPLLLCALLGGCAKSASQLEPIHPDYFASGSAYVYQPINPITVWFRDADNEETSAGFTAAAITSPDFNAALLRDLDTQTVRIGLDNTTGSASATNPIVNTTISGQSYVLIVDYIMYHSRTLNIQNLTYQSPDHTGQLTDRTYCGSVPLYTGIGLRIRAEFTALKGNVNISGLPALALAADAGHIAGRIAVQTMGITGKEITALMPIMSDIDGTSIQNAVQAVAAIKSKIHEPDTTVYPKIVGFESPSLDPRFIAALTSHIYAADHSAVALMAAAATQTDGKGIEIRWDDASDQSGN